MSLIQAFGGETMPPYAHPSSVERVIEEWQKKNSTLKAYQIAVGKIGTIPAPTKGMEGLIFLAVKGKRSLKT